MSNVIGPTLNSIASGFLNSSATNTGLNISPNIQDAAKKLTKGALEGVGNDIGSLAANYDGGAPATHDVVHEYVWTLTDVSGRNDIPQIILNEHRCNESILKRQMRFYASGAGDAAGNAASVAKAAVNTVVQGVTFGKSSGPFGQSSQGLLKVYEEIFPDSPTNNKYILPYFSKTFMELNTSQWEQIDDAGKALRGVTKGIADSTKLFGRFGKAVGEIADTATAGLEATENLYEAGLRSQYPVVGVFDRPRIFTSHSERALTVEFPLYNTKNAFDWIRNRNLLYKFMTQNLYNKRDYITGNPPVYYRVLIPGQYFSFASCVTNFTVQNLGNVRMEYDSFIIPDAYQVSITLQEMVMPSLNQFQAVTTGEANSRVTVGKAS